MFLHRDRPTDKKPQDQTKIQEEGLKTELIIAKQRNGAVGKIDLTFLPQYTKFVPFTRKTP
jgi:replicative DNA helicase